MPDPRPRRPASDRPQPGLPIPDSQIRALDRRHTLEEQQRHFLTSYPAPHFFRRRPPA
ncbi:MAG TPA: hypothetical protein VKP69_02265 [Isosphaeraceae bacterium]|nr:hypothetical protein [Isosphaeraceae bacterium]